MEIVKSLNKLVIKKVSGLMIALAGSATVLACTLVFHEIDIPKELKENHDF